ncbi:hypothetical protein M413DRAFT_442681 [Hebeloma cylindrosporum]|uniref:Uncharacterized protein n=1 Tax=Hebeloma cylindrosporum TaxID=76867 RepID=A0A0C3CLT2_HEBCY|nr:hypothetical protein M413DRAFT_442681 [Hebeloma cylindrosporum h7]
MFRCAATLTEFVALSCGVCLYLGLLKPETVVPIRLAHCSPQPTPEFGLDLGSR